MNIKSIAIEGSDGSGKATTTELLKNYFLTLGLKVGTISFPRYHETTGGKLCREVLKSERKDNYNFISLPGKIASLLYVMDRAESKDDIQNLLNENDILIFDRYVDSNFIHQGGKIVSERERSELISFLADLEYREFELPKPDITFFLHLPVEIAIENKRKQRLVSRNQKVDAGEDDLNYLQNSNLAGLWCARKFNWPIIECFDKVKHIQKSKEEVLNEVLKALDSRSV